MARVTYGDIITNIVGSIGGITFQSNSAGKIVKLKNVSRKGVTPRQRSAQTSFSSIAGAWQTLTLVQKQGWNNFALANLYPQFYGGTKRLNGYQMFLALNGNRALCGLTVLVTAPASVVNYSPPSLNLFLGSSGLTCYYIMAPARPSHYVVFYLSPCIRAVTLKDRRVLRFIDLLPPGTLFSKDLTSSWQSYFGQSWSTVWANSSFNILAGALHIQASTGWPSGVGLTNASH